MKSATLIGLRSRGTTNKQMIVPIGDSHDQRLEAFRWRDRQLASSTDRKEKVGAGLFIAEGDLVVDRALQAGCTATSLLCDDSMAERYESAIPNVVIYTADENIRRDVTGLGVPLRAMGLFQRPPLTAPESLLATTRRLVVAEAIDNPTNLGAIIRSAVGLGWEGILLSSGSADPLARRALRVSMGTGLMLPFARMSGDENIQSLLRRHEFRSFALTPHASGTDLRTISLEESDRVAIFLGSERDGLHHDTMSEADELVRIPMYSHVDSLNVGAAAAIALFELGPT